MNITIKVRPVTLAICTTLLQHSIGQCASIEDITNYKPQSTQEVEKTSAPAYSIQEIIKILPNSLNNNETYEQDFSIRTAQNAWQTKRYENDPRAKAFDEENFGNCEEFYIRTRYGHKVVGGVLDGTLRYLFPNNEDQKFTASEDVKESLKSPDEWDLKYAAKYKKDGACASWAKYNSRLKEIINTIIQSAPTILQAKRDMLAAENASAKKKMADDQTLAASQRGDRAKRESLLNACQDTSKYKIHKASINIESSVFAINNAQSQINRQKEGAAISGIIDKQVMYQMGNVIVAERARSASNFDLYKKLGGPAKSIESVKELPNPCGM